MQQRVVKNLHDLTFSTNMLRMSCKCGTNLTSNSFIISETQLMQNYHNIWAWLHKIHHWVVWIVTCLVRAAVKTCTHLALLPSTQKTKGALWSISLQKSCCKSLDRLRWQVLLVIKGSKVQLKASNLQPPKKCDVPENISIVNQKTKWWQNITE